jgi:hypothetical protein
MSRRRLHACEEAPERRRLAGAQGFERGCVDSQSGCDRPMIDPFARRSSALPAMWVARAGRKGYSSLIPATRMTLLEGPTRQVMTGDFLGCKSLSFSKGCHHQSERWRGLSTAVTA